MMTDRRNRIASFNQIQGVASTNVPAYSNGDEDFFSVEQHCLHGIFTGFKWQCVEYARRWLLMRKQCIFKIVPHAADIFTGITSIERVTDGKHFPLKAYRNGSLHAPQADSLLIFSRTEEQPFGHIAIICKIGSGYVRIGEQNYDSNYWPGDYARELRVTQKDCLYYIEDDENVVTGWMEIEDNQDLKPLDESKLETILKQYQQPRPPGTIEHGWISTKNSKMKDDWLDKTCPAEKCFIDINGEEISRFNSEQISYYKIDNNLFLNLGTTSNEIHRIFMEATNRVINDDELMIRCGIPEVFWSRIRQSWINDQNLQITGRLDLAFNGKELKVFKYNADSASALFECAIIQQKWANAFKLEYHLLAGFQMHRALVNNWKHMNIRTRVHLLIDNNLNDMPTTLYMQQVMIEAGIETKLCQTTDDLYWNDGTIIDRDGQLVTIVWKLWTWETIFQEYFDAQKEHDRNGDNTNQWMPTNGDNPRLSDILLNDQIKVIEPLWKVITTSKALLSVLWSMYPNHPNLLHSEWTLTDELKRVGYVKKTIINRNSVYQELFHLANFDGYYPIFDSWIIHGRFMGFYIREDQKLITKVHSPIAACTIIWK